MITIKEFMEIIDYRVTEGSRYCWECFGDNAYSLDSWNGDQNGSSFGIVFDTKDHTVYQVSAYDYANDRAYRMINPDFVEAHNAEAKDRDVDAKQAWDDVNYVDIDVDDDFIQKSIAIRDGEDYDTRIQVPIDIPDDVLFGLMKMAHEKDITLNQLIEEILLAEIDRLKSIDDSDLHYELEEIRRDYEMPKAKMKKRKKDKK
jgi:hypothetical protein